ncbi:M48 family metallopeptidase [Phascolarctobacterium sp.]|uniref:M48 family metallopeptidase n=1 Tax=Phascolarctobacterium sp. TaxID=2049039 RepID=UPI002A7F325F|nr:M48 family metallopeptidase [Phascolarctobacterium sp.]MDY5045603.1 M48 family metallopeptidase [Phascolarctobacterium sp.]
MYKLYKLFLAFVVACCCFVGLQPAEAGMISLEDEIKMGRETAQSLEAKYGLSQDYYLNERVDRIGQRLAAVCGRNEITYSFKVLNSNEVNALACPGGFIYVFKGLMDYMPSDTELAGVLGHEVGHVAKKHTVHSIEKQLWTSLILLAATRGQGLGLVQAAQQALFAGYSRTDERGADKEGVNNTIKAGFNPYAMLITVQKLDDLSKQGGGAKYGLFSSHPEPEERVKRVMKQLKAYDIHPDVTVADDNHATVTEGNWRFDINQSIGNTKAKYRAYMLAGGLWNVRQRGKVNPNYFVVYDNGSYAHIYYDDIQVLTLYTQDAGAWGSAGAYASACVDMLRDWAVIANENDAKAAAKAKKKK